MSNESTNPAPRIALLGAGGNLGRRVARRLLAEGYTIRAISRPETDLRELHEAGVQDTLHLDLRQAAVAELTAALEGCPVVISTLGVKPPFEPANITETEDAGLKKLVEAAQAAGVEHYILTSSLGTERPEAFPYLTAILQAKRQGELHLINSGLPYTIVRPGGLTDDAGGQKLLVGRGDQINGRISREDVAAVLLEALKQPAARGQVIEIVADENGRFPGDPNFFAV